MAGSRRESVGNILQRLQGLLKSGAMKEGDRPIWYDVVKTFPPRPIPPPKHAQKILYPEDFVRVHYKKTFSNKELMKLNDTETKTVPERFVDTYMEMQRQKIVPNSEIFEKTASRLKEQGFRLITQEEAAEAEKARVEKIRQKRAAKAEELPRSQSVSINVDDLMSIQEKENL